MPPPAAPLFDSSAPVPFERRSGKLRRASDIEDARRRSFLRLASHELRTPLNAIVGFSEILAGELYGPLGAPQYREYAEHVRASGYRLLRLINQMIDLARLDGGMADLVLRVQPIDEAVVTALETVKSEAALGEAPPVKLSIAPDLAAVADGRGLHVVLVNLLQTALARTAEGGEVTLEGKSSGRWCEIAVRDHGPEIAPDALARMLDPFEAGPGELASLDGAGLGLAIARMHCAAMGGVLRLETPAAGGLLIKVSLPAG